MILRKSWHHSGNFQRTDYKMLQVCSGKNIIVHTYIFLGSVIELSEKLETQQKISRVKRLENEDLRINIKEKDEKIAGIIRMMSALNNSF